MKRFGFVVFVLLIFNSCLKDESWKYLEQNPPGLKPEIFAPGIISGVGRLHSFPAISPDGKQILWMKIPPKIYSVEYKNNAWSQPELFPYLENYSCLRPMFSFDGKRVYFSSAEFEGGKGSSDIWYLEKTSSGYSNPINVGSPVNTEQIETCQTLASNGNMYFTGYVKGKRWDRGLLVSKFRNGKYSTPEILPAPINIIDTNAVDYLSFIAPDESYLLFASNRLNIQEESCRIYVSFRDKTDHWSEPINVSEKIGFDFDSRDPYVSPDQKYLFFSSGENIYWLDASVIKDLKKENQNKGL